MNKLKYIVLSIFIFFLPIYFINQGFAAINLAISPIKYEIEGYTGTTITKTAKIRNPGSTTIDIITGKSDFVPNGKNGIPKFIRKSEMVFPDQQLAEWIDIDIPSFSIAPGETKEITFNINIPDNATPGGHYGAVFFKKNNSENSNGTNVGINVDYGVLILLKIKGKIIVDIEIKDPIISNSGGGSHLIKDNCPNGDNSESYYDKTCESPEIILEDGSTNTGTGANNTNNNTGSTDTQIGTNEKEDKNDNNEDEDFKVGFTIPVNNKGNSHIKPKGKIILKDEDGNIIKKIGKETVINDKGVVIGDRIVDYIPINDIGGNVIPGSSRKFTCEWKGFPYRDYDNEGNPLIKFWNPSEYYTKKNLGDSIAIMPWEKIEERSVDKNITAEFIVKYEGLDGKELEYNSAKEFPVSYTEKYVAINYFILCPIILLLLFLLLLFIIAISRKTKCEKCEKSIKKDMKICPYCGAKQKKKK